MNSQNGIYLRGVKGSRKNRLVTSLMPDCEERTSIIQYYNLLNVLPEEDKYHVEDVYKITSNQDTPNNEDEDFQYGFHGTLPRNLIPILNDGFKSSGSGCCGYGGVYIASVSSLATKYGQFKSTAGEDCTCVVVTCLRHSECVPKPFAGNSCEDKLIERNATIELHRGQVSH